MIFRFRLFRGKTNDKILKKAKKKKTKKHEFKGSFRLNPGPKNLTANIVDNFLNRNAVLPCE